MDIEAHRNLQALEAIAQDAHITQRTLANNLGIALGLTNIYRNGWFGRATSRSSTFSRIAFGIC